MNIYYILWLHYIMLNMIFYYVLKYMYNFLISRHSLLSFFQFFQWIYRQKKIYLDVWMFKTLQNLTNRLQKLLYFNKTLLFTFSSRIIIYTSTLKLIEPYKYFYWRNILVNFYGNSDKCFILMIKMFISYCYSNNYAFCTAKCKEYIFYKSTLNINSLSNS